MPGLLARGMTRTVNWITSFRELRDGRRPSWLPDARHAGRDGGDLRTMLDDAAFAFAAILLADEFERVVQRGDGRLDVCLRFAPLDAQAVDLPLDILRLRVGPLD